MVKYIYIDMAGNAGVSDCKPTPEDLTFIGYEILEVLCVDSDDGDLKIYRIDESGGREDPNKARQVGDDDENPYHYIETR